MRQGFAGAVLLLLALFVAGRAQSSLFSLDVEEAVRRAGRGEVVELTNNNFDRVTEKGRWLVKFYAPWCGHCQRLAPVLEEVARDHFKGSIKIGKVDCTSETALKERFKVNGFPQLEYLEDGEVVSPYNGGRDVESLNMFAARMSSNLLREFQEVKRLRFWLTEKTPERDAKKEPISFVLTKNPISGINSVKEAEILEVSRLRRPFQVFAKCFAEECWNMLCDEGRGGKASFCAREGVALVKFEKGETSVAMPSALWGNVTAMSEWVLNASIPVFAEVGLHNFGQLTNQPDKMLVMGAVDPRNPIQAKSLLQSLHAMARSEDKGLLEEAKNLFIFSHIDGTKWADFLEDFGIEVHDLPRILVLDFANDIYIENKTLESDLVNFMNSIARGDVETQSTGWILTFKRLWRAFKNGLPMSAVMLVLVVVVFGIFFYMLCFTDFEMEEETNVADFGDEKENARESRKDK